MRKKIVFVGAGSAVFTKGLVLDILERAREKWHIALVDTDREALDTVHTLCRKMIDYMHSDTELSASTQRRELLPGADYVVCTIGVGGRRAWEQDVFIPRKYGIFQPVGDTVGPGGISRAMRMIPAMVSIAEDISQLCPQALMFNYSNPMTMICMAVRRATGVPVIGLCHGVSNGMRRVAGFMGMDVNELSFTACGLNHMVFCYHLRSDGRDIFPDFIKRLDAVPQSERAIGPLTSDFVRRHHAYVVSDDRHYSEFVPGILAQGAYFGKTLGIGDEPYSGTFSFEGTIAEGDKVFDEYKSYAHGGALPDGFFEREEGEHEHLMSIIDSIETDTPGVFYVNAPNGSAVDKVPSDIVVERPALINGSGIYPLQLPDFPISLLPPMLHFSGVYEAAAEAALKGDASLMCCAVEAASMHLPPGDAQRLTDELLAAHKEYLPQF